MIRDIGDDNASKPGHHHTVVEVASEVKLVYCPRKYPVPGITLSPEFLITRVSVISVVPMILLIGSCARPATFDPHQCWSLTKLRVQMGNGVYDLPSPNQFAVLQVKHGGKYLDDTSDGSDPKPLIKVPRQNSAKQIGVDHWVRACQPRNLVPFKVEGVHISWNADSPQNRARPWEARALYEGSPYIKLLASPHSDHRHNNADNLRKFVRGADINSDKFFRFVSCDKFERQSNSHKEDKTLKGMCATHLNYEDEIDMDIEFEINTISEMNINSIKDRYNRKSLPNSEWSNVWKRAVRAFIRMKVGSVSRSEK